MPSHAPGAQVPGAHTTGAQVPADPVPSDTAPPDRATRAARAEASVTQRNIRRFWAYPPGRLGVITSPGRLRHRLFVNYNYWWQAHLMDCLVDAELRDPDAGRRAVIRRLPRALWVRNRGTLVNDYFDDIAWLALAMGRARDELGLRVGAGDMKLARHLYVRWRADAAGGGIPWRRGDSFRNVPANGSMAIVMARVGRLDRTRETVAWIYRFLHDPETGMILEGRRPDGVDRRLYTYNQGLVLGSLLELVKAGDDEWRPHLRALVQTIRQHCTVDDVLNPCGGGDGGLFAAITARYLTLTALQLPGSRHQGECPADDEARTTAAAIVRRSADAAWDNRAESDRLAPPRPWGHASQAEVSAREVWFGDDWKIPAVVPDPGGFAANSGVWSSVPASRDLSVQLAGWMVQELAARLDRDLPGPASP